MYYVATIRTIAYRDIISRLFFLPVRLVESRIVSKARDSLPPLAESQVQNAVSQFQSKSSLKTQPRISTKSLRNPSLLWIQNIRRVCSVLPQKVINLRHRADNFRGVEASQGHLTQSIFLACVLLGAGLVASSVMFHVNLTGRRVGRGQASIIVAYGS